MRQISSTSPHAPFWSLFLFLLFVVHADAQSDQTNLRFTQGEVNDGAGVSLSVPLATFPGRGLNLPVSLSYSSSVWRIDHLKSVRNYTVPPSPYYVKQSVTQALYAEHSKAGWKSGLDLPQIEWPKIDEIYSYKGQPASCCWTYRIARLTIHMPDGSSHNFRKSDRFYIATDVDMLGTFYAVDGSRLRYDSTGVDTGTLFMPDGTRYELGHPVSYLIDRNGNRQSYNENTRQWTDNIGRVITNPIPANPQVWDYPYTLPGLAGGVQTYIFKWRRLADVLVPDAGNNVPALRHTATHFLPDPGSPPTDTNGGNFPLPHPAGESLFRTEFVPPEDESNPPPYPVPVIVVGSGESAGQTFNPIVLAEIVMPGGGTYKFGYNVYGEISKVTYPTTAFERYEYDPMISDLDQQQQPYVQAQRKVSSRKLSIDGSGDDLVEWRFSQSHSAAGNRMTSIVAPDNTRKEIIKLDFAEPVDTSGKRYWPFGQSPSQNGMVFETRFYSASPSGLAGDLLRRELTQYDESVYTYTYTAPGINPPFTKTVSAYRNARPSKSVSVIFEGAGPALASAATFVYDATNEFTTGLDQTEARTYNYSVVANTPTDEWGSTLAKNGTIQQMPIGSLARWSESIYRNDPVYRDQNILGLIAVTKLKNTSGATVSQSETTYDECPIYCFGGNRGLATSIRLWDSSRGWSTDPYAYITSHSKFDEFGNKVESTDAKGYVTTTVYDPAYQAFPISVVSPVPDPTGQRGSNTSFNTRTTYDYPTGLPLTSVDANDQVTRMEYNDPLLRPTRVIAPNGQQTITEYGAGTSESTRWVKVRSQIDDNKWAEAVSHYDGLGRTYSTEKMDSNGAVFTEIQYDLMGRVSRTTHPFKNGETRQWTASEYDDLSRTKKVVQPGDADTQINYGLSTDGILGTTKTIIDPAGKQRTGIVDALGNMIRIYEGSVSQNLFTDYLFDAAGNLRQTIQGQQSRYFMYDSLGRVVYSKQPEEDANASLVATDPITLNSAWSQKHTYDANGNLLTETNAANVTIAGTYDRFNRLIRRDYSDATPDIDMYYDGTGLSSVPNFSKGKMTKVASSVSETRTTSFDSMGRVLTSEQRTGTQTPFAFRYVYNLSGGLVEETYPSGRVIRNTFYVDGELSQVQSKKNTTSGFFSYADAFEYNASGAPLKMQLGNGHWETAAYDPKRLQVTAIGLGITSNDRAVLNLEFAYNSDGQDDNNGAMRLQRITVGSSGNSPGFTATQSYFYDFLNRVSTTVETVGGNQIWKQSFNYDRYGNRRFGADTTTLGNCPPAQCNPNISTANNRFLASEGYTYDVNGSMTKDASGSRFLFDAEGRQNQFYSSSNQTAVPDATYEYDGNGRRIKKTVGSEVTIFVYDAGGRLAAEYSTTVVAVSEAKVNYTTTDHVGSPRIITDQYGRVISRKDFSAFGEEITSPQRTGGPNGNGYDPPGIRQDYTGYEKDLESGLEFAQARYYNTAHGRFTSVDPLTASASIRNPQSFNRYSYALNSPYKFTDPLGLCPDDGKVTTQPCEIKPTVSPQSATVQGSIVTQEGATIVPNAEVTLPEGLRSELTQVGESVEQTSIAFEQDRANALEYGAASLNQIDSQEYGSEVSALVTGSIGGAPALPFQMDGIVSAFSDADPNEIAHSYTDGSGQLNFPASISTASGGSVSVSVLGVGGSVSFSSQNFNLSSTASALQASSNALLSQLDSLTSHQASMQFARSNAGTSVGYQVINPDGSRGPGGTTALSVHSIFVLHSARIAAGRAAAENRRR